MKLHAVHASTLYSHAVLRRSEDLCMARASLARVRCEGARDGEQPSALLAALSSGAMPRHGFAIETSENALSLHLRVARLVLQQRKARQAACSQQQKAPSTPLSIKRALKDFNAARNYFPMHKKLFQSYKINCTALLAIENISF